MLHVLICEDNTAHREHIASIVTRHIDTENVEIEVIVSTGNPLEILAYLEKHPDRHGLYLLDIDLQHDKMDGIDLAKKIRETDRYADIAFITTQAGKKDLTFEHQLKVTDFIVKNRPEDIESRTIQCVVAAYERYIAENAKSVKYYSVDANGEVWDFPYNDIMYFETKPKNRLALHTAQNSIEFRGFLNKVEKLIPEFCRCHTSFLVNLDHVEHIDKLAHKVVLLDGRRIDIAQKRLPEVVERFLNR